MNSRINSSRCAFRVTLGEKIVSAVLLLFFWSSIVQAQIHVRKFIDDGEKVLMTEGSMSQDGIFTPDLKRPSRELTNEEVNLHLYRDESGTSQELRKGLGIHRNAKVGEKTETVYFVDEKGTTTHKLGAYSTFHETRYAYDLEDDLVEDSRGEYDETGKHVGKSVKQNIFKGNEKFNELQRQKGSSTPKSIKDKQKLIEEKLFGPRPETSKTHEVTKKESGHSPKAASHTSLINLTGVSSDPPLTPITAAVSPENIPDADVPEAPPMDNDSTTHTPPRAQIPATGADKTVHTQSPPTTVRMKSDGQDALLNQIRQGKQLKKVVEVDQRMKPVGTQFPSLKSAGAPTKPLSLAEMIDRIQARPAVKENELVKERQVVPTSVKTVDTKIGPTNEAKSPAKPIDSPAKLEPFSPSLPAPEVVSGSPPDSPSTLKSPKKINELKSIFETPAPIKSKTSVTKTPKEAIPVSASDPALVSVPEPVLVSIPESVPLIPESVPVSASLPAPEVHSIQQKITPENRLGLGFSGEIHARTNSPKEELKVGKLKPEAFKPFSQDPGLNITMGNTEPQIVTEADAKAKLTKMETKTTTSEIITNVPQVESERSIQFEGGEEEPLARSRPAPPQRSPPKRPDLPPIIEPAKPTEPPKNLAPKDTPIPPIVTPPKSALTVKKDPAVKTDPAVIKDAHVPKAYSNDNNYRNQAGDGLCATSKHIDSKYNGCQLTQNIVTGSQVISMGMMMVGGMGVSAKGTQEQSSLLNNSNNVNAQKAAMEAAANTQEAAADITAGTAAFNGALTLAQMQRVYQHVSNSSEIEDGTRPNKVKAVEYDAAINNATGPKLNTEDPTQAGFVEAKDKRGRFGGSTPGQNTVAGKVITNFQLNEGGNFTPVIQGSKNYALQVNERKAQGTEHEKRVRTQMADIGRKARAEQAESRNSAAMGAAMSLMMTLQEGTAAQNEFAAVAQLRNSIHSLESGNNDNTFVPSAPPAIPDVNDGTKFEAPTGISGNGQNPNSADDSASTDPTQDVPSALGKGFDPYAIPSGIPDGPSAGKFSEGFPQSGGGGGGGVGAGGNTAAASNPPENTAASLAPSTGMVSSYQGAGGSPAKGGGTGKGADGGPDLSGLLGQLLAATQDEGEEEAKSRGSILDFGGAQGDHRDLPGSFLAQNRNIFTSVSESYRDKQARGTIGTGR